MADGSALPSLMEMIEAQGGDLSVFEDMAGFHKPGATRVRGGVGERATSLRWIRPCWAGRCSELGAGREKAGEPVDPHAGIASFMRGAGRLSKRASHWQRCTRRTRRCWPSLIIRALAWLMLKTMRISGAESMNVAASIFMGQTEAPLTIRPFLSGATRSELMTIMTSGMAHVSGGIMAMYISQGIDASHLLSAVIMTSPGTILMAKMLVPETGVPATEGRVVMPKNEEHKEENLVGAIARGTLDGGKLAFNVGIMLVSFLALVALLDSILNWIHLGHLWFPGSLGQILGFVFAPVAWLIGVPWRDAGAIGNLLGTRMALNEVIAYIALGAQKATLAPRSFTIATFALCGFANLGSVGMQIGGIGALVPERRNDLAKLGIRAMLAGTMANLISASIAGMFLG
jgi:CNT family concentrative nucleoside transporter